MGYLRLRKGTRLSTMLCGRKRGRGALRPRKKQGVRRDLLCGFGLDSPLGLVTHSKRVRKELRLRNLGEHPHEHDT